MVSGRKNKDKQDFQALCFSDETARNAAYQDIEERRLKEWENFQKSHRTPEDQRLNRAFIDVIIGDVLAGRLVIDLYDTVVPRTVERFRAMITGELGVDKETGTKIDYLHTKLQCIDHKKSLLCFGSFSMNVVPPIQDENFSVRHTERGLLTMISHGPNSARSAFGITLGPAPSLDFKQVAFGKVVDGVSVLDKLETAAVNSVGKPLNSPFISFCGVLTGKVPPGVWEYRERTANNSPVWMSKIIEPEEEEEPMRDTANDEEGNPEEEEDNEEKMDTEESEEKNENETIIEENEEGEEDGEAEEEEHQSSSEEKQEASAAEHDSAALGNIISTSNASEENNSSSHEEGESSNTASSITESSGDS